jgi:hypothetical protein
MSTNAVQKLAWDHWKNMPDILALNGSNKVGMWGMWGMWGMYFYKTSNDHK